MVHTSANKSVKRNFKTVEFNMTNSTSIAFVVSKVRPERCGVSDYSIRMVALLSQRCKSVALLAFERDPETAGDVETCEGSVRILDLNRENAKQYDVLIVQYVPNNLPCKNDYINKIRDINHPRVYLMLHEIWYTKTLDYKLPILKQLKASLQKFKLKKHIRAINPRKIFTSNLYYQTALANHKIISEILPIIGTIPNFSDIISLDELILPEWWNNGEDRILWVSFGSIYAYYWDCLKYFKTMENLNLESKVQRWVICGQQTAVNRDKLILAATDAGCLDKLHFTGSINAKCVDWFIRNADFSFSGSSQEVWRKSTGVLAALERKVPVYLPRNTIWITSYCPNGIDNNTIATTNFRLFIQQYEIAAESQYTPSLTIDILLGLLS